MFQEVRFADYAADAVFGGIREKIPDDYAEKKEKGIIRYGDLEEMVKNHIKDAEHQERFQDAPEKSQDGTVIFQLEISPSEADYQIKVIP